MKGHKTFINPELRDVVDEIVTGYQPERVMLFGSHMEGTAGPDSDYDLLIIKETKDDFLTRLRQARRTIRHYPSKGIDLLVYTPEELNEPNYFVEQILDNGIMLYERSPIRTRNSRLGSKGR